MKIIINSEEILTKKQRDFINNKIDYWLSDKGQAELKELNNCVDIDYFGDLQNPQPVDFMMLVEPNEIIVTVGNRF